MKGAPYERKEKYMSEAQAKDFLRIMHSLSRIAHAQTNMGIMPKAEFYILASLDESCMHSQQMGKGGITVSNLARKMDSNLSTVSKLLRVVEDKGYVARFPDDIDRRVVYYGLTEKGQKEIAEAKRLVLKKIQSMLDLLGEHDTVEAIRIFSRLLALVSEAISSNQENKQESAKCPGPSSEIDLETPKFLQ